MNSFIRAILTMFSKKKVKFLGRAGLLYLDDDGKQYYLNSELVSTNKVDLLIWNEKIYLFENGKKTFVGELKAKEIFKKTTDELFRIGIRYRLVVD